MTIMTAKRRRFCQYSAAGLNNTEAAKKAGFKESSAKNIGYQLSLLPEVIDCIKELKELDKKHTVDIPVKEDLEIALLCKDPMQKLMELMNCKDELIELQAAKILLPYMYLQAKDKEGTNKLGKKELKEVTAITATNESKFSTLGNQLSNTYEHEKEELK